MIGLHAFCLQVVCQWPEPSNGKLSGFDGVSSTQPKCLVTLKRSTDITWGCEMMGQRGNNYDHVGAC